ncbi:MAG: hypothetical protein IT343_15445 [Candidatus Melainabacteria bacterium]|nr:hypothetical protein [Candidatus Melainabacteria bacterium]
MNKCKNNESCRRLDGASGRLRLQGIYRVRLGERQGQRIWLVDGARVARYIYPAFIMGGNDQRYRFNPDDEVWIDNRIGIDELEYTIAHELIERKLMRERGYSYGRAHEAGLALEQRMRKRDEMRVLRREKTSALPVGGVYRSFLRTRKGVKIWIVDGPKVRRHLDGDFCFAGHGYKYDFIPRDEIWLDSAMSVEQAHFALVHEYAERLMSEKGLGYDVAYPQSLALEMEERERQELLSLRHELKLDPVRYGVRERGVRR